jgi:hypothetical protein
MSNGTHDLTKLRPFNLASHVNSLEFAGYFDVTRFRLALAALHDLTALRGYEDVQLDFSRCDFTHAPPMLALAAACEQYQSKGIDFNLVLPIDEKLNRLFLNSNWAHIIEPEKYPTSEFQSLVHMPALHYVTSEEQFDLINRIMDKMLASVIQFERNHFKALEWSINEITDNVLVHSQSPRGGLIQLTALKNVKKVEFVVCDCGIGVPTSLRSSHGLKISSDVDALAKAIEQGVTRDKSVGQGNGLYGSYQIAVRSGAPFGVHSGYATLYYTPRTGMHTRKETIPMTGTMVVCGIDYTQPLLLEEALGIKTMRFSPVDIIETKYETTDDGNINFLMKNEAASFGSRKAGTPVRNKLRNLVAMSAEGKVVIDFVDIHLVSSSFADEVIGKLFLDLGPLNFSAKIELRNVDPTVKLLIDKAIIQRLATGSG